MHGWAKGCRRGIALVRARLSELVRQDKVALGPDKAWEVRIGKVWWEEKACWKQGGQRTEGSDVLAVKTPRTIAATPGERKTRS